MRKRTKLSRIIVHTPQIISQLLYIEEQISSSQLFHSHATSEDDLSLTNITLSDLIIIEAIKELSPNSAGGPDGIPTSLLINCAEEITPVLKINFSHSLSSSIIPTSFKEAAIIPVFKSDNKSLPSNYRPISLTSVLSKVI